MANWYAYNGIGDPALPGSYYLSDVAPNCLVGGCKICAIYLDQSSDVPSTLPGTIKTYIANALMTLVSQPANGFRRYVYVKDC